MPVRRPLAIAPAVLALALHAGRAAEPREPPSQDWTFQVALDGRPIGLHRFSWRAADDGVGTLTSEADFAVRLLGLELYRYRHQATERWRGGCLRELEAQTDDGGKRSRVRAQIQGEVLRISEPPPARDEAPCLMSYAYWQPALLQQSRLLNPQTGQVDAVRIERADDRRIAWRGGTVEAAGWRIVGPVQAVDLWYAAKGGGWIGLDAEVAGGRRLQYRMP